MKNHNDPRANRSRRALMDSAIELFLVNPTATMSDVAEHAGIGRATLYRHYDSREKLIYALALESLEMTDQVLRPIYHEYDQAKDILIQGIKAIMPLANRFHFLLLLWNISSDEDYEVMTIYNNQLTRLAELIKQGKEEKSINKSLSTSWIVMLVDSLIYVGWWSIRTKELTVEEAADQAIISLLSGIES